MDLLHLCDGDSSGNDEREGWSCNSLAAGGLITQSQGWDSGINEPAVFVKQLEGMCMGKGRGM